MATLIGSGEAARILGVTRATLYAYVSRGLVGRRTAVDGRTSLYDRSEVERLAARRRRRPPAPRPSIDVQVTTTVSALADDALTYRGHDAVALAADHDFEQAAELLWTGSLPDHAIAWAVDTDALARARAVVAAAGAQGPLAVLALAAAALEPGPGAGPATVHLPAVEAARELIAIVPSLLGGPDEGPVARRLATAWTATPSPPLVDAITTALVLLADHELATCALAARVAASVRTTPLTAIAAGLMALRGRLHGGAEPVVAALLDDAAAEGAGPAVTRRLQADGALPGFGHAVYRDGDPRFRPLLDAVRALPDPGGRMPVVDAVLAEAGRRQSQLPNVDLAVAALLVVGGLPRDAPLLAIARIAGLGAHVAEELEERPLRYRGLARTP